MFILWDAESNRLNLDTAAVRLIICSVFVNLFTFFMVSIIHKKWKKTSFLLCMVSWPSSNLLNSGNSVSKVTESFHHLTFHSIQWAKTTYWSVCLCVCDNSKHPLPNFVETSGQKVCCKCWCAMTTFLCVPYGGYLCYL